MKQQKTYFGWVNDHSGSMAPLAKAALKDFNSNIEAVKTATSDKQLDAVVSVVGIGFGPRGIDTERQIVNSNPHVLKPMTEWSTDGGTPLYDGIGDIINLLESLPDAKEDHVSFLVTITTDGEERHSSKWTKDAIYKNIKRLQDTGRWTFVFRVPKGGINSVSDLGAPLDNIQEWETTEAGIQKSTQATAAAIDQYVTTRASGKKATGGFFATTANVNLAQLTDVSADYKLYRVGDNTDDTDGMMISNFMLKRRMQYLKGAGFYQLVKTESKVGPDKQVLIQERTTGKIYAGQQARDMLGIPRGQNARLHPGQLTGYNVFIQSTSWNRKLPMNTGVLYNDKLGTPFTQEEIDRFTLPAAPKVVPQAPASLTLPEVNNTSGKPVKSTMPVTQVQVTFYATREDARNDKRLNGADYIDLGSDKPKGQRFQKVKKSS
jgi:hypothetical protein